MKRILILCLSLLFHIIIVNGQKLDLPFLQVVNPNKTYIGIIANEDYQTYSTEYTENALHAIRDAERFKNHLIKTHHVPERNISYYPNAMSAHIKLYLAKLIRQAENAGMEAEIIFYYSGIIIRKQENFQNTYLLPIDVNEENTFFPVSINEVLQKLNSSTADKVTVFIDAFDVGISRSYSLLEAGIEPIELDNRYKNVSVNIPKQLVLANKEESSEIVQLDIPIKANDQHSNSKDQQPPELVIISPAIEFRNAYSVKGGNTTIKGYAKDDSGIYEVVVNGAEAHLTEDGRFTATVLLAMGNNKIRIQAMDSYKNVETRIVTVTRLPDEENLSGDKSSTKNLISSSGASEQIHFHALIIGIDKYENPSFPDLDNPVQDAQKLYDVLKNHYIFQEENIIFLKNPGREQIIISLDRLESGINNNDNLLIFFAGHGHWDAATQKGYWLPADAGFDNTANWIRNSTISGYISGIQTKHTLLIADACFSGGIFRTRAAFSEASDAINRIYELPSRKAMTSGTLNVVPDESIFIYYLIKNLQENQDNYLSAEKLFFGFKPAVLNNSDNIPQYGVIKNAGDEGGDFIFIRK